MLQVRKKMVTKLEAKLQSRGLKNKRKNLVKKILAALMVEAENSLFVFENGKTANTTGLRQIAKKIWGPNHVVNVHHFTAYTF